MLTLLFSLRDFRTRAVLQAEILALRHQLLILQRSSRGHKHRLRWTDRVLWVWLSRLWNVFHAAALRRILNGYFDYHERCRTHLSLEKDAPVSRTIEPRLVL